MILGALRDLALREGIFADPEYEKKRVDFVISLTTNGKFLGITQTQDEEGKGKEIMVPRMPKRASGINASFLFDNVKYVLGIGDKPKRAAQCRTAFAGLVASAARETGDPGLAAMVRFYENVEDHVATVLKQHPREEWTGSELIAFSIEGDDHQFVHDRPAARKAWSAVRAGERHVSPSRCLVTGGIAPSARLHGSIKRVPDAQSSGASLVSFNKPAFESHGLSQGENAAVCQEAADAYVTALNWLLEGTSDRTHRYGVRLGEDTVTVFWTKQRSSELELFASLWSEKDAAQAVRAAESPWRGTSPSRTAETPFYAVTIGGNAARVVVRDWFESTMAAVKQNVLQYFDHLAIGRIDEPLPLRGLLDALKPPGTQGRLQPDLGARMFRAALSGQAFPRELLRLALTRIRVPPRGQDGLEAWRLRARASLIKATLIRLPGSDGSQRKEIAVSLDLNSNEPSYLLGRLFSVLERLQAAALGDVNASIRDRYFASASTTPAWVFPRLLRVSMHHASKADSGGYFEKIKGDIMSRLPATGFPKLMSLEEQGLFAVGYYHQRDYFFTPKDERPDAKIE